MWLRWKRWRVNISNLWDLCKYNFSIFCRLQLNINNNNDNNNNHDDEDHDLDDDDYNNNDNKFILYRAPSTLVFQSAQFDMLLWIKYPKSPNDICMHIVLDNYWRVHEDETVCLIKNLTIPPKYNVCRNIYIYIYILLQCILEWTNCLIAMILNASTITISNLE